MSRYPDVFRNTLMVPHQIVVKCDLEYQGVVKGQLNLASGSVSADRSASVQRTAQVVVDANQIRYGPLMSYLRPYGTRLALYRGVRYPDGTQEMAQVFYGRIEGIEATVSQLTIRCADLAADVIDARFPNTMTPERLTGGLPTPPIVDCITALIHDVHPGVHVDTAKLDPAWLTQPVRRGTSWQQERGDALDSLCTQLGTGCEWYAGPDGDFHIAPLPAMVKPTDPVTWIIDGGDRGVLVDRTAVVDRANVYNGVVVTSEPVGGVLPAYGDAYDEKPGSATEWGGPFGKVVQFYTGQQVNTTDAAEKLAAHLLANSISGVQSARITCVPNPKLQLADVVRFFSGRQIDWMAYVQNMTIPMDPETAMSVTLFQALEDATPATTRMRGGRWFKNARRRVPEGALWLPIRSTSSTR